MFDDFIRSRLVDYFLGTQQVKKEQLLAARMLLDWRKIEIADRKEVLAFK